MSMGRDVGRLDVLRLPVTLEDPRTVVSGLIGRVEGSSGYDKVLEC